MNRPAPQRLFFALWPDAAVRARLAACLPPQAAAGRPVPAANLHMTLVFLGAVDAATAACAAAAGVTAAPFSITLDTLRYSARNRMLWLLAQTVPAELLDLQRRLTQALAACGFTPEARAFRPHVTLARKLPPAAARRLPRALDAGVIWPPRVFALLRSVAGPQGSQYQVVERWPLPTVS